MTRATIEMHHRFFLSEVNIPQFGAFRHAFLTPQKTGLEKIRPAFIADENYRDLRRYTAIIIQQKNRQFLTVLGQGAPSFCEWLRYLDYRQGCVRLVLPSIPQFSVDERGWVGGHMGDSPPLARISGLGRRI